MKHFSLVMFLLLAGLLACTRPSTDSPPPLPTTPDTVSEIDSWPWDSGWLSTGMNPQGTKYIATIATLPEAIYVIINNDSNYSGGTNTTQEAWKNSGLGWVQIPLPGKAYLAPLRAFGKRLYWGSIDSGIFETNLDGKIVRRILPPQSSGPLNFVSFIDSTSYGILASFSPRGGSNTNTLVNLTDSEYLTRTTSFDKNMLPILNIYETSNRVLLLNAYRLYSGDLNNQTLHTNTYPASFPYESWQYKNVTSIVEYNGKLWTAHNNQVILRLDPGNLSYIDSINQFQHSDTFNLQPFVDKRGDFGGLLKYQDLLFICGQGSGPLDFTGVWVWNEKRQWFQHTPLFRRGIRFNCANFFTTVGISVWRDTLYAVTKSSRGMLKRAISDVRRDLERDTARWSP